MKLSIGVNGGALKSNGSLGSHIQLGNYDTSCLSSTCTISVGLWLKYWPATTNGQSHTFLDIHGLFTLFQPQSTSVQLGIKAFPSTSHSCDILFNATAHIWSQIFVTINAARSIRIYINGLLVDEKSCGVPISGGAASGLITLNKDGALAEYDDLVIWNTALSEIQIKDIFKFYTGIFTL